jgi:hypothetical protein
MSTGPVQYRIFNTVVSGNELQSSLTGGDVRVLEFDAACRHANRVELKTGTNDALPGNAWVESAINTLLLDADAITGTASIPLGGDTVGNAQSYQNFFDMQKINDERLLRFAVSHSSAYDINLVNGGSTNVFVKCSTGFGNSTTAPLFVAANTGLNQPFTYNGAGVERLVVLRADNVYPGSESVTFHVLPFSN